MFVFLGNGVWFFGVGMCVLTVCTWNVCVDSWYLKCVLKLRVEMCVLKLYSKMRLLKITSVQLKYHCTTWTMLHYRMLFVLINSSKMKKIWKILPWQPQTKEHIHTVGPGNVAQRRICIFIVLSSFHGRERVWKRSAQSDEGHCGYFGGDSQHTTVFWKMRVVI